jgi:hypothetical protein
MLAKKWGVTNKEVELYLKKLFDSNEELRKMLGLMDDLKTKQLELLRSQVQPILSGIQPVVKASQELVLRTNVQNILDKAAPALSSMQELLARVPKMADGGIVTRPTQALIGEAGAEAVIPLDRMGSMGTRVTVNVAGSVISEGQLQSVIQDVLYNLNRTGAVTQLSNLGR